MDLYQIESDKILSDKELFDALLLEDYDGTEIGQEYYYDISILNTIKKFLSLTKTILDTRIEPLAFLKENEPGCVSVTVLLVDTLDIDEDKECLYSRYRFYLLINKIVQSANWRNELYIREFDCEKDVSWWVDFHDLLMISPRYDYFVSNAIEKTNDEARLQYQHEKDEAKQAKL